MEMDWRFGAGCAVVAFVISVMFGIVGGVQFGTLMLRAFLGACAFAVIGTGGRILTKKFLPELFEFSGKETRTTGENIDIVIQDGSDETSVPGDGDQNPILGRNHNHEAGEIGSEEAEDVGEFDSLVEEMEEVAAPAAEPETVRRTEPARETAIETAENVDDLPDMGEMEASFGTQVREQEQAGGAKRLTGTSGGGVDTLGSGSNSGGQDPAHLAKVLQTILKKGSEG